MPRFVILFFAFTCIFSAETVRIDGSSTVYPISYAVAQQWQKAHGRKAEVLFSGSSGGMRKLVSGEIDIGNMSRAIHQSEIEEAAGRGITLIEIPVAIDGLTVVVNRRNDFVDYLTVDELKRMWEPNSGVRTWADVRPGWPKSPIGFACPGKDSGTFEYFTYAITGKAKSQRTDVFASEDDHALVQKVAGNVHATSYFGWAYFVENELMLRAVPVAPSGAKPVVPSQQSIVDGSYRPLARPLFIYVNAKSLEREEVAHFVATYLELLPKVVPEVGYVYYGDEARSMVQERVRRRVLGSAFVGTGVDSGDIASVLRAATPAAAPEVKAKPETSATMPATMAAKPLATAKRDQDLERLRAASLRLARLSLDRAATPAEAGRIAADIQAVLADMQQAGADQPFAAWEAKP